MNIGAKYQGKIFANWIQQCLSKRVCSIKIAQGKHYLVFLSILLKYSSRKKWMINIEKSFVKTQWQFMIKTK